MDAVGTFEQLRPLMFSIAYRMLGSVADAEDVLQEAFLRWQRAEDVRDAKAFLTTVVSRLCLDHLRSARVRRERYVGPWLPEPLVGEQADAAETAELADSASMAFLLVLETLTPPERAAFLLREVFDYPYPEVAEMLSTGEANCRQLVHRARERVRAGHTRFEGSRAEQRELMARFLEACATGEVAPLAQLLAEDAVLYSDGGGQARAAQRPIYGAEKIARFVLGILRQAPLGMESEVADVNGALGIVVRVQGRPFAVLTGDAAGGKVQNIYILVNPEKLRALDRPGKPPT